jgi:hypothetical protein
MAERAAGTGPRPHSSVVRPTNAPLSTRCQHYPATPFLTIPPGPLFFQAASNAILLFVVLMTMTLLAAHNVKVP